MLNMKISAMLHTGLMISIIPVALIAEARKRGFDTMSLELVEDSIMKPVMMPQVAKRVYIPSHGRAVVSSRCTTNDVREGVLWPTRKGVTNGVFKIQNEELVVPVVNNTEEPMLLREGDELDHWGTEKWKETWEDANPLMLDSPAEEMSWEERQRLLFEQIKEGSKKSEISEEVQERRHFAEFLGEGPPVVQVRRWLFRGRQAQGYQRM
ncbi:hypothetical protein OESDEN_13164 [Oesophagostomum dentatum]|uniref:Uncharacterized protein n=1 Tax=Oesophagostomum dentatum TaxID=61180 RepID=A0A0B1SQ53_OESDE|nr:hypothetical protein OESDEN_13164 [Oesophagostomum dentatum]